MAQQKKKNHVPKIIAVIVIMAALVIVIITDKDSLRSSKPAFEETKFSVSYDYEDKPLAYSPGGKGIFLCTKDSMRYVTTSGNAQTQWQELFSIGMKEPVFIGKGNYAAVYDAGSNSLYVFSSEGKAYQRTFDGKILTVDISAGGYGAVIVKNNSEYRVLPLSLKGEDMRGYLMQEENIFPTGVAISDDGSILAISIMDINGIDIESSVQLQYTDGSGVGIFYNRRYPGEMVLSLKFIDSNNLAVLSDNALRVIQAEEVITGRPRERGEVILTNKVDAMEILAGKTIAVAYGEPLPSSEARETGLLEFFDIDLYSIEDYSFGKRVDYLKTSGNHIVAGTDKRFVNFNSKGRALWEYHAAFEVRDLVVTGKSDTALVIGAVEAVNIKKTGKNVSNE